MPVVKSQVRSVTAGIVDWAVLLVVFAAAANSGCAARRELWLRAIGPRPQEPTSMVVTVSPSMMFELGKGEQRGMLSRVYFFRGDDPVPVKVSGELTFVAYDTKKGDSNRPPDGVYTVSADSLGQHYRKDVVGPSYVCWLGYEPQQETQILVQARFRSSQKTELVGKVVSVDLQPTIRIDRVARAAGGAAQVGLGKPAQGRPSTDVRELSAN
jgi:hypothetical protein